MDSDGNTFGVIALGAREVEPTSSKQISIAWLSFWCLLPICGHNFRKMRPFAFFPWWVAVPTYPLGDGAPTPLYHALLNRRSDEIVSLHSSQP
jgi:hypothetical protein